MLRTIIAVAASALILSAADPWIGTWKANPAKSKYNPGPGPKSNTATYSADGDWVVLKTESIDADGKATTATNRYKRDGKAYPFNGPLIGKGTISVKAIDDHHADAVLKSESGNTVIVTTAISKDGKTRTQTSKGTTADGRKTDNIVVFDKQ